MVVPSAPESSSQPSPPDDHGRGWVVLGLLLLVLPILLLVGGLGLYIYLRADDMAANFERVRKAEEEAAQAEKRRRAEREAELLAEFHDAFGRENRAAAGAVLDRLTAEGFDSPAVAECRAAWEKSPKPNSAAPGPTVSPGTANSPSGASSDTDANDLK